MSRIRLTTITVIIIAAAVLVCVPLNGCGKRHTGITPPLAKTAPAQVGNGVWLDSALAELDELPQPKGVDEEVFALLKDELAKQLRAAATKAISTPPEGDANKVGDLLARDNGDGTFNLEWHYRNLGDYDQNGTVGISDITPIAQHYGETANSDPTSLLSVIDGSGNGTVDIADITPLAQNYGVGCGAYIIESATAIDGAYGELDLVGQADASGDGRLMYNIPALVSAGEWVRVTPLDGDDNPGIPSDPEEVVAWADTTTFDVTWDPATTLVDQGDLGLLLSSDPDTFTYTFDAAGVSAAGLDMSVDRILVIYGQTIRRITATSTAGNELTVETDYATLPEAISDGTIEWDYGINFTPDKFASAVMDGRVISADGDGNAKSFEFTSGEYKFTIELTMLDSQMSAKLTVEKGLGAGATGKFVVTGNVERFRSKDRIDIAGNAVTNFDSNLEKMQGDLTLELVVAASGDDFVNIELPFVLLKYPFMLGPIPVIINVKLQFVAALEVPFDGSSWVKVNFKYDSDIGFKYDGVDVGAAGRLGDYNFGKEQAQTGASSGIVANFGVGFPRVELEMAGEHVVPWAQTAFLIEGNFTPVFPALQQAKAAFIGAVGINLEFFGFGWDGSLTLFQEEQVIYEAGET